MDIILELCNKYDVILLEDNCESMGSKYNDKYLGTFGHVSFFSMYFGHHLSTIEGGFINTNDDDLYHMLLMMRSHGWDRDLPIEIQKEIRNKYNKSDFDSLYNFYVPGFNLRSTDLQAFLGIRAIDSLDEYCSIRNENFNIYNKGIKNNKLNLLVRETDFISNFAYPIVSYNRDNIIKELRENKIEARPLISGNIANKPFWYEKYDSKSNFKNADIVDSYGFYLPNHHELTKEDINLIIKIIESNK
jgi:CDP-6-deoxy-D-xylo-4-hexulose-3-dehydrase